MCCPLLGPKAKRQMHKILVQVPPSGCCDSLMLYACCNEQALHQMHKIWARWTSWACPSASAQHLSPASPACSLSRCAW